MVQWLNPTILEVRVLGWYAVHLLHSERTTWTRRNVGGHLNLQCFFRITRTVDGSKSKTLFVFNKSILGTLTHPKIKYIRLCLQIRHPNPSHNFELHKNIVPKIVHHPKIHQIVHSLTSASSSLDAMFGCYLLPLDARPPTRRLPTLAHVSRPKNKTGPFWSFCGKVQGCLNFPKENGI